MVDAEQLRLVDVLVKLLGERARRREVVPEGLLHHHPRVRGQPRIGEALHDPAEEERRDLEVEDRSLGALDRGRDPVVGGRIAEVARHVGEARREPGEHVLVDVLAGADDRRPRPLDQLVDAPVVDRDPDDRAVDQLPPFEAIERAEGHHLREVAGDPEDHEHVAARRFGHDALTPVVGR